ncbi:hypothetical protein [Parageobacillus thermoglucosidasius]|uniref:HTH cro/C1-type domain-containing protein n=1 Tax=Parageobacillus thermoglucosidasius TaxID=1426 RepID=A0AB38R6F0_PARTM|nr:hypothetical protein [Parageobacillus thermoglucosidasius]UOE78426.1 hypothetical protein IMI45_20225 [Parageobacillus thermoglucosidasius]
MLSNTQYLSSLKKEQELKQKWEKRKKELEKCLDKLTKALNTKEWLEQHGLPVYQQLQQEIEELSQKTKQLKCEIKNLFSECEKLREQNNSGNLRHVVYMLYTEQGLSIEQFAKLVDSSPEEILELTKDGIVTEALLERICSFFGISKTKEFMKYVRIII